MWKGDTEENEVSSTSPSEFPFTQLGQPFAWCHTTGRWFSQIKNTSGREREKNENGGKDIKTG